MKIIPAIDLLNGRCVRLLKGDYSTAHKVAEDPAQTAKKFAADGAKYLHVVDLDGAKSGSQHPENFRILRELVSLGLTVDCGGGVRSFERIDMAFDAGVDAVTLGSAAIKNHDFAIEAIARYGHARIIIGLDALDGYVKTDGWTEGSSLYFTDAAKFFRKHGARRFIFTDISRDGTLFGPNINALHELCAAVRDCEVTASGGVGRIDDVKALIPTKCAGVIIGKAIYEGTLNLKEAIGIVS